jgi:hypothetical protein
VETVLPAPTISWLTICPLGQPEKAIGLEPQIEPWLAIFATVLLVASETEGVVTTTT